jgi:hypothetical protein
VQDPGFDPQHGKKKGVGWEREGERERERERERKRKRTLSRKAN